MSKFGHGAGCALGTWLFAFAAMHAQAESPSLAAGGEHTCTLRSPALLECFGSDYYGQLGDGQLTPALLETFRAFPAPVVMLTSPISGVATGSSHTCAVANGGARCWGQNFDGQLGRGGTSAREATPADVDGLQAGVIAVTAGTAHSCAIITGGVVQCWGNDDFGQVGDGLVGGGDRLTPFTVVGLAEPAIAIAAGSVHTCALLQSGSVSCWGYDGNGQLGDGAVGPDRASAAPVTGLGAAAIAVTSHRQHSCVLLQGGAVRCWGSDANGQLGDGVVGGDQPNPSLVSGLAGAAQSIAAGRFHTCAVLAGGRVQCWGGNASGQLGFGTAGADVPNPTDTSPPLLDASDITAGNLHTCAKRGNNDLWCWGDTRLGQLGDGTSEPSRATPAAVIGLGTDIVHIEAGWQSVCARRTSGALACWGEDDDGQLGDGTVGPDRPTVAAVTGISAASDLSAGGFSACAVVSGAVQCWGGDTYGQLGDGTIGPGPSAAPVAVQGLPAGITSVAVGGYHACALDGGGGVHCWGNDNTGQLGDGSPTPHSPTAQPVSALSDGVTQLVAGAGFNCALRAGAVLCWGGNMNQELGVDRLVIGDVRANAEVVPGLASGIVAIAAGLRHTCALRSDGALLCWGDNERGALGSGNLGIDQFTPTVVAGLPSAPTQITAGSGHTCALLDDASVWCWGSDYFGQLGDGVVSDDRTQPQRVQGMPGGAIALTAAVSSTCALLTGGSVACWGSDLSGQLGDGTIEDAYRATPTATIQLPLYVDGFE